MLKDAANKLEILHQKDQQDSIGNLRQKNQLLTTESNAR